MRQQGNIGTIKVYMRKFGIFLIIGLLFTVTLAHAQQRVTLDKVAGVVGGSVILQSDIELQYAQNLAQGMSPDPNFKCMILNRLLIQKLLAQQAVIDSVTVSEDDVDNNIDRRMRSMMQRAGGQDRLEQFLGRSLIQYKDEIRADIKEGMIAEKMQGKITEKTSVTPQEVKRYFDNIPKDSLPSYNKEVEVGEIVFQPKLSKEEKQFYKEKAEALRTRVKNGEDFGNIARLYSQDPGSAAEGGDLGFFDRNTMAKEFTANAFKLKAGEISPVFETEFGFHFLQVIERRGEQVHARHVLIMPVVTPASLQRAKAKADSVYTLITKNKQIDFSTAASVYSDNKESKYNGGMLMMEDNVTARTTLIPTDKLDPAVALIVDTMKVNEISMPHQFTDQQGKQTYKIHYLRSVTDAHKANLAQDLPKLKIVAQNEKVTKTVNEWFEKKRKNTFVRIDPEFQSCPQLKDWVHNKETTSAQANP